MRSRFVVVISLFVFIGSVASVYGEIFNIAFVSPKADSLQSESYALIAGGYVHDLEVGMKGAVLAPCTDGDTVIIGTGEVVDVSRFESSCLIRQTGEKSVEMGHDLVLEPWKIDKTEFVEKGIRAFEASDFERAQYFISRVLPEATPEDSAALVPIFEKSMSGIKKWLNSDLNEKERAKEEKKTPAYLVLAQYYLTNDQFAPASYYLAKLLRVHPDHEYAKVVYGALGELFHSDPEKLGQEALVAAGYSADDENIEIYPEMIRQVKPVYPHNARTENLTGVVKVKALVSGTGRVLRAAVLETSGHVLLDNAAVAAAYGNKFKPGIQGGKAVNCWVTYKVTFELDG